MSADYTNSKFANGDAFPEQRIDSDFARTEPLLTPEQLINRFLFGIPLISNVVNPITNKRDIMTVDLLKDYIIRAISKVEVLIGIDIFPVQYQEKAAFDRNLYTSFMYMRTRRKPILSVDKLSITPADGTDIYVIDPTWIEPNGFQRGQINVVPIRIGGNIGSYIPLAGGAGGATFLSIFAGFNWVPGYWQIIYTAGFKDGAIPKIINELVGLVAASDILSMLASTYRANSYSTSIDGISQSVSGPGPQLFDSRLKLLTEQRNELINKVKGMYSLKLTASNI